MTADWDAQENLAAISWALAESHYLDPQSGPEAALRYDEGNGYPGRYDLAIDAAAAFGGESEGIVWDGEWIEAIDGFVARIARERYLPTWFALRALAAAAIHEALENNS